LAGENERKTKAGTQKTQRKRRQEQIARAEALARALDDEFRDGLNSVELRSTPQEGGKPQGS
jgi:hypothetical protein